MEQSKLYARDELYRMLAAALIKKKPLPPEDWNVVKLDEEVTNAGSEYEPSIYLRHQDALTTCVYYLVDFALRMPEWINLSTANERVCEMCGELADEIEQITYEPDSVIAKHGKLKVWLKAKLAVQTCWIYREETERIIAEKEESKRRERIKQPAKIKNSEPISQSPKWQSDLAQTIFNKVTGKSAENSSAQPSLF
ncbi:MAG TPA: hypothetical protein PKY59_04590 [Pyrinomonadaceae bacterium]|nr:hypothetical protein [Pyrinomonadaceae bacterium]